MLRLFKRDSRSSSEAHPLHEPSFPPPSFIRPNDQNRPMIARREIPPMSTRSQGKGLPPPPFQRGKSSRRPRPTYKQSTRTHTESNMNDMVLTIDRYLLIHCGYTDHESKHSGTGLVLRREPGNDQWTPCMKQAANIAATHNFDFVCVLRLDLMHVRFRFTPVWSTVLAESNPNTAPEENVRFFPITTYNGLSDSTHWVRHSHKDLPTQFTGGFSRILNQLPTLVREEASQPVTVLSCLFRPGYDRLPDMVTLDHDSELMLELVSKWTSWI